MRRPRAHDGVLRGFAAFALLTVLGAALLAPGAALAAPRPGESCPDTTPAPGSSAPVCEDTGGTGGGGGGGGSGGTPVPRPAEHATRTEFRLEPGNLNLAVGNTGVRFNPFRKMLISANLLFALTEAGLRDRVTPVLSVDYAF